MCDQLARSWNKKTLLLFELTRKDEDEDEEVEIKQLNARKVEPQKVKFLNFVQLKSCSKTTTMELYSSPALDKIVFDTCLILSLMKKPTLATLNLLLVGQQWRLKRLETQERKWTLIVSGRQLSLSSCRAATAAAAEAEVRELNPHRSRLLCCLSVVFLHLLGCRKKTPKRPKVN